MRIKDLPAVELPRERLIHYGVENLSNAELISIVLRTGVKETSVKEIADNILNQITNISDLGSMGIRELSNIRGMGNVKAITLLAAIELGKRVNSTAILTKMKLNNVSKVHDAFKSSFAHLKQEKFIAVYLDNKKCLLSHKILFLGTINCSIVHPREIFNEAIKVCASSVIVIHNHPSGDLTPSTQDKEITRKLIASGNMLGIPLIDHIITNGKEYFSFYDEYNEAFKK